MADPIQATSGEGSNACPTCGGRGWHTAGGNDPMACNCAAGEGFEFAGAENVYACPHCHLQVRSPDVLVEDVREALDAIDKYAAEDLDHDLHAIVEHYRRALGVAEDG